jgi:nitrogen fixation protein FixH
MRNLIVIISTIVVAMTIGTIIVGNRMFDGVVVERPYDTGLAWDKAQKRQARLGWKVVVVNANLKVGSNELILGVSDRDGTPLKDAAVEVTVSRPSTKAYDRIYRAVPGEGGRYQVPISLPIVGLWDIRTEITRREDLYTTVERIEAIE